jgi:hypothetical protein
MIGTKDVPYRDRTRQYTDMTGKDRARQDSKDRTRQNRRVYLRTGQEKTDKNRKRGQYRKKTGQELGSTLNSNRGRANDRAFGRPKIINIL